MNNRRSRCFKCGKLHASFSGCARSNQRPEGARKKSIIKKLNKNTTTNKVHKPGCVAAEMLSSKVRNLQTCTRSSRNILLYIYIHNLNFARCLGHPARFFARSMFRYPVEHPFISKREIYKARVGRAPSPPPHTKEKRESKLV